MGVTTKFLKLRSTDKQIKLNQWHNNFSACKKFAESNKVPFIAVWSNGDKCGHCILFEEVLMKSIFKKWMKTSQCVFWFGYYGDTSKDDKFEGIGFNWCYNNGKITGFPFVRIYWKSGKVDVTKVGGDLTGDSNKDANAKKLVNNLNKILKNYKPDEITPEPTPEPEPVPADEYKIRFNEKLTVAQINKILDSIDTNDGYCPCQPKSDTSKCHCKDFIDNKKIGEVCICNLYVKMKK